MNKRFLFVLLIFVNITLTCRSQNNDAHDYFVSTQSGKWESPSTWENNVAPPYKFENHKKIIIDRLNGPDIVYTDNNVNIQFNNFGITDVYGKLIIKGNLVFENHGKIHVHKGGVLIVHENINMHMHGEIIVDGELYADSIIGHGTPPKHNYIKGGGDIYTNHIYGFCLKGFYGNIYSNPLPVELLYFKATADHKNRCIKLKWATATETNNDYFTIKKSHDGSSWNTTGFVNGKGNSNNQINYQYQDNYPVTGISYYKLKQTDFDGSNEIIGYADVKYMDLNNIRINSYQNTLFIKNMSDNNIHIEIASLSGRLIYRNDLATYSQISKNINEKMVIIRINNEISRIYHLSH